MSFKHFAIEDFCITGSGGTPYRKNAAYYDGGTIPWVKSGELRENVIYDTEEHVTQLALKETNIKLVPKGAILLAMYGATVGRMALLGVEATTNQAVCHIIPNEKMADRNYLYHCLQHKVPALLAQAIGGAQPNINQQIIKRLQIPLPPLAEQQRIAAILDTADALRAKRRAALATLDTLLQSTFLHMFGSPITNPKGWQVMPFGDVCDCRLGKMLDAKQQTGKYLYPYLRNANVQWDRIELDDVLTMDFDERDREKFRLQNGDLLICEGGEAGRTAIWRGQLKECYYQKALHRARVNPKLATPEYLLHYMWLMARNNGLKDHTTSATIAHLTGVKLKQLPVLLPPLAKQQQFTNQYEKTHCLRNKILRGIRELDTLFHSLQQRAFKGEL